MPPIGASRHWWKLDRSGLGAGCVLFERENGESLGFCLF
jgi:hypothetical protein